jgi:tripartite-type tricarboxylate transporter receptor subunit TctC
MRFSNLQYGLAIIAALTVLTPLPSAAEEPFKGKTIRLVVATPPGGGYDTYGRLVARHLGEHLPGRPNIVVTNMPGASGMSATTWLYSQAPRDGTVFATFNKSQPFYQALGQPGVRFKTEELGFFGSLSQAADHAIVWHTAAAKTIFDAMMKQVVMGADSGGTMTLYPALLNVTIGTRFKIVTGYPGSAAVALAMEKGEVEGVGSTPWSSLKATHPQWVARKEVIPLVQIGLKKDADLPEVPLLIDLARTDAHKQLFAFVSKTAAIERPFAGPPGLPAEIITAYRRAFAEMVADSKFRQDAKRLNLDLDPQPGEVVSRIVSEIVTTPPAIVAAVKSIVDEGR